MRGACLAVCLVLAGQAHAQLITHDPVSNGIRITEAARALQQGLQQLRELERTYSAVAHATNLQGIASAVGGVSRTYLPQSSEMTGMLSMAGGVGRGGRMFGQAESLLSAAQRYRPPGSDQFTTEMDRRERITANAQAMASEGLTDLQQRVANMEALKARLEAAQDVTEVAAVQGLIAVEQQNMQAHTAQLAQVRLMLDADTRVTEQRDEQAAREALDELRQATAAQRQALMPSTGTRPTTGRMVASSPDNW